MKIKLEISEDRDGCEIHKLYINEKHMETIGSLYECPEDAIIGRDLIDGGDILTYMKMAYEAGKNNEELIIE